jgi:hypothetical protein
MKEKAGVPPILQGLGVYSMKKQELAKIVFN